MLELAPADPGLDAEGACSDRLQLGTDRGRETPAGTYDGAGGNTGPVLYLGRFANETWPGYIDSGQRLHNWRVRRPPGREYVWFKSHPLPTAVASLSLWAGILGVP